MEYICMSHPDAVEWNARYRSEPHRSASKGPRALLTSHIDLLPARGLALDMACGTASTGRFLAAHGWQVIGLDVAESALRLAQARAHKEAESISFAVMDLTDPWLPDSRFNVILNFYYLARPLWARYKTSIKPGGLLFFETFLWQPGLETKPEHYLQSNELKLAFTGWDILHYEEMEHQRDGHKTRRAAQLVARKPE
jgi:SAM-dependent methyltransferase